MLATNSWGPSGLLSRRSGSSSTFYSFDAQGNVAQRLSSTGSVLSSHGFDAYGAENSTTSVTDPYAGYGGRHGGYTDPETGLTLFSNRYYDPSAGRWINRDPIGYAGGINVYSYCLNNPGNNADPSGLICCDDDDGGPQYDDCYLSDFQSGAHPGFAGAVGAVKAAANLIPGVQAGSALTGKDVFGCNISPMERLGDAVGTALSMIPGGEEAGEAISGGEGLAETAANGPCFVAGTPIEVAEPAQKTIEQLKPGDIVSSQGLTSDDKTSRSPRTGHRQHRDEGPLEVLNVQTRDRVVTLTLKDTETGSELTVVRPADAAISLCEADPNTMAFAKCEISAHGLDAGRDKLETRSIDTILPGMKVASRNPTTGKTEFRTVVRTFKHTVNETVRLGLSDSATG